MTEKKKISPPSWLPDNVMYETIMGSYAYGIENECSDIDIYGFCIPKKDIVFPHLSGEILGFDKQVQRFDQYQQHHVKDQDKEYDFNIFGIVKYFRLLMDNNPNVIDSIFTDRTCILTSTQLGELLRDNRKMFLHKGAWHRFRGYSFSQMEKIETKDPSEKRKVLVEKYGYDTKYACHLFRLLLEVEQIMIEGDLDLRRNAEQLRSVRNGHYTLSEVKEWFKQKETQLAKIYLESKLPHSPDEDKIKCLLLQCLESHYGSLDKCVAILNKESLVVSEIKAVLEKYKV